jgi:hypothetical protein
VGVSDYSSAEIQEGLKAGEVVSLVMPKEELEKKTKQLAVQKKAGGETGAAPPKPTAPATSTGTNNTRASATSSAASDSAPKASTAAIKVSIPAAITTPR